jgi:ferredoxin-NADP reductase
LCENLSLDHILYTARLERRLCLSESAECFHLEFVVEGADVFRFAPGQFISIVAEDRRGKLENRAYSIASAPRGNRLDLCLNRVEDGFFSNLLCDLAVGQTIRFEEPMGFFTLREPIADSILVATGTGIAPLRGFLEWLFPADGLDRSGGKDIWLVFGTRNESEIYYRDELDALTRRHTNFHYLTTLSRATEDWPGLRGYVQDHVARIVEERAARLGIPVAAPRPDPAIPPAQLRFDVYAYICGLSDMVTAVRQRLVAFGWHRKQIVFERYD